jgi:hypothetical protein
VKNGESGFGLLSFFIFITCKRGRLKTAGLQFAPRNSGYVPRNDLQCPCLWAVDFDLLLAADEIGGWRDRTLRWFTELKDEPKIELVYYTDALVAASIDRSATVVCEALERRRLLALL